LQGKKSNPSLAVQREMMYHLLQTGIKAVDDDDDDNNNSNNLNICLMV
jgi:hypothetical protein